jgi:type II secretory pathway component PulJ
MKLGPAPSRRGYMLIECLIYMALFTVVIGLAFSAFYRFLDHSRDLARNAEDILRTLRVGELWRADIRQAIAPPEIHNEQGLAACEIPQTNGRVAYVFADGAVWRQADETPPKQVLPRVRTCAMAPEQRDGVAFWRWELELQTRKKVVRVHPLFTFEAVPGKLSREAAHP